MIDLTKVVFHSQYPNFTLAASGSITHSISTTFTTGTTNYMVASDVDITKQMVAVYVTDDLSAEEYPPYSPCPNWYWAVIQDGGEQSTFVDVYFYVFAPDATNNLYIVVDNLYVREGTYPLLTPLDLKITWYLFDMPAQ